MSAPGQGGAGDSPKPLSKADEPSYDRKMPPRSAVDLKMIELAAIAGVSGSTISRALADSPLIAEATRRRIQALAAEHGYSVNPVARSLRSARTGVIGVVIPLVHDAEQHLFDPFFATMLGHLADELTSRGHELLLTKVAQHRRGWVDRLIRQRRADAVIVLGQSLEHAEIDAAARSGSPVVAWGAPIEDAHYATVGSDNRRGGELAAEHLLATGRHRLAFLGDQRLPEVADRFRGFEAAHRARGLAFDPALVLDAHFAPEDAERAGRKLVERADALDGVVAASDVIALAVMSGLAQAGIAVPERVGVVGFDDVGLAAYARPPLTTVRQNFARGAALLAERALGVVAGIAPTSVAMPVELVVRASSRG